MHLFAVANGSVTEVSGNITDIKYENGTGNRKNTFTTNITKDLYQSTFICNITASLFYQETLTLDTNVLCKYKLVGRDVMELINQSNYRTSPVNSFGQNFGVYRRL